MKNISSGYKIEVIKSKRKTMAIQVYPDGRIVVRAPMKATASEIKRMVEQNEKWIQKHLDEFKEKQKNKGFEEPVKLLSESEIRELADRALEVIPDRVRYYAGIIGVSYGRITIRNQRTKWGSCSSKKNLNFNCLLMLAPNEVLDYVIVHELCHLIEPNHSPAFWAEVERYMPDYKEHKKWLKDNGGMLMRRMFG